MRSVNRPNRWFHFPYGVAAGLVTPAAAEWVKRGPAVRVETPQLLLGEDGNREFLLWLRPARPGAAPSDPDDMLGAIDLEGDQ